ncbi:MAG: hypothetical protein U0176_25700 [Bacteroidia bacterium]
MKTGRWANWCASWVLMAWMCSHAQVNAQQMVSASPDDVRKVFDAHKATCLFFFVEDCPVSMRDFGVVKSLSERFAGESMAWIAVYLGTNGDRLAAIADSIGLPIAYAQDPHHVLVDMASARVTPEYFLFDSKGNLRYRGAIDNYAVGFAKHRPRATSTYLADGIQALMENRAVRTKSTQPFGCVIEPVDRE